MELTPHQLKSIKSLAPTYALDFIVVFGSQVTGHTHKDSDLDLGYQSRRPLDFRVEYELSQELQQIFSDLPVELVSLVGASPLLRKKALLEGQLLFEQTPHSFVLAQMLAYRLFIDALPLFRLRGIL